MDDGADAEEEEAKKPRWKTDLKLLINSKLTIMVVTCVAVNATSILMLKF